MSQPLFATPAGARITVVADQSGAAERLTAQLTAAGTATWTLGHRADRAGPFHSAGTGEGSFAALVAAVREILPDLPAFRASARLTLDAGAPVVEPSAVDDDRTPHVSVAVTLCDPTGTLCAAPVGFARLWVLDRAGDLVRADAPSASAPVPLRRVEPGDVLATVDALGQEAARFASALAAVDPGTDR